MKRHLEYRGYGLKKAKEGILIMEDDSPHADTCNFPICETEAQAKRDIDNFLLSNAEDFGITIYKTYWIQRIESAGSEPTFRITDAKANEVTTDFFESLEEAKAFIDCETEKPDGQPQDFTAKDEKLLEHCEVTIKNGVKHFLSVGQALSTIRTKRLYKIKGFQTFEDYCQSKWEISRQYASQLILTFRLEDELSTAVDKPVVENPTQAKRFHKLSTEEQAEVKESIKDGEDFEDALQGVEEKKKPSELLQAKKLTLKLWEMLERSENEAEMFETLQPLLQWAGEYQERQAEKESRLEADAEFEEAA
jgi:hypothetical protein